MVRLQFALNPNFKGEFYEDFYEGRVRVVDGIAETDNQTYVGGLLRLGYVILEDEQEAPTEVEEVVPTTAKSKTPPRLSTKTN